jgi:beta-N-acetylhexosaminidase
MRDHSSVLQHFLLGFEGRTVSAELRELLAGGLAGVALFPRNFTSPAELRALTDEIHAAARAPVMIAIDQEGGARFSLPEPFTQWPSASDLGQLDDPVAVEQIARAMARELRAVGCNLNFAPMLDLHVNPASPVTTERSFGAEPHRVARLGAAFLRGLAAGGVLGCAKHFPGHGDAAIDPHDDQPIFAGDITLLETRELVPFAAAIAAGVPTIMTAHILLPKMDPARPASLSPRILQGMLREKLGFEGVILADDVGMGALRRRYGWGEAAVLALAAGSDIVMLCHDWFAVTPTIAAAERACESNQFDEIDWRAARLRIEELLAAAARCTENSLPLSTLGNAEHATLAEAVRERIEKGK